MFVINHYIQHSVHTQALQRFRRKIFGLEIIRMFVLIISFDSKVMSLAAVQIITTNSKSATRCTLVGGAFLHVQLLPAGTGCGKRLHCISIE